MKSNDEIKMDSLSIELGREFLAHYGVKGMKWGVRKDRPTVKKEDSSGGGGGGGAYLDEEDQAEYDKLMDEYKEALDKVRTDLLSGNVLDAIKSLKKASSISSGRLKTLIEKQDKLQKKDEDRIDKMLEGMRHSYPSDDLDDLDDLEDFLAHYGVKGMKWGVRKDRKGSTNRAFKRAIKKHKSLTNRAEKLSTTANREIEKGYKNQTRGHRDQALGRRRMNSLRTARGRDLVALGQKQDREGMRTLRKSQKLDKKAVEWERAMREVFADVSVTEIDPKTVARGQEYIYMLLRS